MTDAPGWKCCGCGAPPPFSCNCVTRAAYAPGKGSAWKHDILATPEALAKSPHVEALVKAAVEAERERCIKIAVRHWEGEPEDTIAMVDEMRAGEKPLTEYERKVAQMKEDFPNGI